MEPNPDRQRAERVANLYLGAVSPGETFFVLTQKNLLRILYLGYGAARISGDSESFPAREPVNILGSATSGDGKCLEAGFIREGMRLELQLVNRHQTIITSPVECIFRVGCGTGSYDH
jgi:hypothetical protein